MDADNLVITDISTQQQYVFRLSNSALSLVPLDESVQNSIQVQSSSNWPTVGLLRDGDPVSAETFNGPIGELTERTKYLYDKLRVFDRDNPLSAVVMTDVSLDVSDVPNAGDVVYLDSGTKKYRKALATTELLDMFTAAGSSFAVGVLSSRSGSKGNVVIFGKLSLDDPAFNLKDMVEPGESFRNGMYYLSCRTPGKLTATPGGPRVAIGQFFKNDTASNDSATIAGDFALVHVESRDFSEAHVHRGYALSGKPAGEQAVVSDHHVYYGYAPEHTSNSVKISRLVFSGDYLCTDRASLKYTFVLGGSEKDAAVTGNLEFGANPGVYLYWHNDTTGNEGRVEFSGFGERKEFEYGMYVELRPDPRYTSTTTYALENSTTTGVEYRSWSAGMTFPDAGMGWRDLSDSEKTAFSGRTEPKFVYNVGFDKAMQVNYPPVPLKSAYLVKNGVTLDSDQFYDTYTYSVERDSVYWYDDTEGNAPWPASSNDTCKLDFYMTHVSFLQTGPVMSLRAKSGSGIKVLECGTDTEDDVGDLELDFDPTFDVADSALEGFNVVKEGTDGKLLRGPVVERVVAGPGITVGKYGESPQGQGTVVISANSSGIQGEFEEVALQNAKQDLVGMFPYVRLLGWNTSGTNTDSAFILKFHVPYDVQDVVYKVHFSCSVFGTSAYSNSSQVQHAGVTMQYNILPDSGTSGSQASANVLDDLIQMDAAKTVSIPLVSSQAGSAYSYKAYDPVYVHTVDGPQEVLGRSSRAFGDAFPKLSECQTYADAHGITVDAEFGVRPGYTVAVKLARGSSGSGLTPYTGSIGFMNARWSLEPVGA